MPLVRMSQDDPLNPSSTKNYQVDSENNNLGESNMINEKVIKNPKLTSVQAMGVSRRMPVMMTGVMMSQAPLVSCPSHSASLAPKVRAEDSWPSRATRNVTRTSTWTEGVTSNQC